MDDRIWQLAGPRRFLRDVAEQNAKGRHVAVVLPRALIERESFVDAMAVGLIEELRVHGDPCRIHPEPGLTGLVAVIHGAMSGEPTPATVPDLIEDPDTFDRTAVLVATDLSGREQAELGAFLTRVELESRSRPVSRLSLVVLLDHAQLPRFAGGETSDVTMTTRWWWNRISRWDVASHVEQFVSGDVGARILVDLRVETVVEVAKWDLRLAEELADEWRGDLDELAGWLAERPITPCAPIDLPCGEQPSESALEPWSAGTLDGWHDIHAVSLTGPGLEKWRLNRTVWSAQARIMLPWVEQRRLDVERRARERLGADRFRDALRSLVPPLEPDEVVEIGRLKKIIETSIGTTDLPLRNAARRLTSARNRLAHLRPIPHSTLVELVAACEALR